MGRVGNDEPKLSPQAEALYLVIEALDHKDQAALAWKIADGFMHWELGRPTRASSMMEAAALPIKDAYNSEVAWANAEARRKAEAKAARAERAAAKRKRKS